MSTPTLLAENVAGRRVEFAYYSDLHSDDETVWHPGTIVGIAPGLKGAVIACLHLDGSRWPGPRITVDYEGLRYLDEVTDVPVVPMGRFLPSPSDIGFTTCEGVLLADLDDDAVVLLTDDRAAAHRALVAHARAAGWDMEVLDADLLQLHWVVFEWQPEDAESDWEMQGAAEGDDMAVQVHYLPF